MARDRRAVVAAAAGAGAALDEALPPPPFPSLDRLLLQRMRKSQSGTTLYGDGVAADTAAAAAARAVAALAPTGESRLIVVANRLPVSASRDKGGAWNLQVSAGGLVSALMSVQNFDTVWVGWPGVYVSAGPDRDALTAALHTARYAPVYLDPTTVDLHYNGFCNSVLWQLFHYVPLNLDSTLDETKTLQTQWAAHQAAAAAFADAVLAIYRDGDVVWVQGERREGGRVGGGTRAATPPTPPPSSPPPPDYHLMLLPALLKLRAPRMKVGWFLHTPFPSSEIYRTLPVREEVLRAVLRADLVGFHTYDYARHFVSACTRILGLEGTPEGVEDAGSLTRVAAFPIGIDPERFSAALERPDVRSNIAQLLNRYAGRKVEIGGDGGDAWRPSRVPVPSPRPLLSLSSRSCSAWTGWT